MRSARVWRSLRGTKKGSLETNSTSTYANDKRGGIEGGESAAPCTRSARLPSTWDRNTGASYERVSSATSRRESYAYGSHALWSG